MSDIVGKLYVSDKELTVRWSCSRATIWRWSKEGLIPKPYKIGGSTRWKLSEILDYESKLKHHDEEWPRDE